LTVDEDDEDGVVSEGIADIDEEEGFEEDGMVMSISIR
jgi:hypothetical protein